YQCWVKFSPPKNLSKNCWVLKGTGFSTYERNMIGGFSPRGAAGLANPFTQRLEAASFCNLNGRAEARPLQNACFWTGSKILKRYQPCREATFQPGRRLTAEKGYNSRVNTPVPPKPAADDEHPHNKHRRRHSIYAAEATGLLLM